MEKSAAPYSDQRPDSQNENNPVIAEDISSVESLSASPQPVDEPGIVVIENKRTGRDIARLIAVSLLAIFLVGGGIAGLLLRAQQRIQLKAGQFDTTSIPIKGIAKLTSPTKSSSFQVNGRLNVNGSLVLTPTSQPNNPLTGQLFYDKDTNLLSYFNGSTIIALGGGGTAGTTINNVSQLQTTPLGVQLQTTAPGTQQTGNFNISGTGQVGVLKTGVIDATGTTLFINPIGAVTPPPTTPGTPGTLGLTTLGVNRAGDGPIFDSSGFLYATRVTTGNLNAIAHSITVYLERGTPGRHIQVGLYDDDGGLPSRPNVRLAVSASTLLVPDAYNTVGIPSVTLTPNTTYWMTFSTDDHNVLRPADNEGWATCFSGVGYAVTPNPFGGCYLIDFRYTTYLNYTTTSSVSGSGGQAHITVSPIGQVLLQNSEDSASAFTVQDALSTSTLLNVDTLTGRIAIGKSTANFKLDVAGGDINLGNNQSLRFGGLQVITASPSISILSNLALNGSVVAQGDNFIVRNASATYQKLSIDTNGAATFTNGLDTAAAFRIQNAAGTPLFVADTTNMRLTVGGPGGSGSPVLLYLGNKNTSGDPIGSEGATYYNGTWSSFRCFYSGFWHNCADIEPQHNYNVYDEFLSGQTSFAGQIGGLGWTPAAIGANGSLALNPTAPAPTSNRPGILRLRTPAVANQGTTLLLGDTTGGSMLLSPNNDLKTAVGVSAASGQVLRVGLHDQTTSTAQPVSGVWWEADATAHANWRYCYGDGTIATCAASAVPIAADAWATLEIRVVSTGVGTSNIFFVINNTSFQVSGVTVDSTTRVSPALSCFTTGASNHDCYWDYYRLTGISDVIR